MADGREIKLSFLVDLQALENSASKVQDAISKALSADNILANFDSKVAEAAANVSQLAANFSVLSREGAKATVQLTSDVGKLIAELNQAAASFENVGNASGALASGALADSLKIAAYGPGRGPGGRFTGATSAQEDQLLFQRTLMRELTGIQQQGIDQQIAAVKGGIAQKEAAEKEFYDRQVRMAQVAAEKQAEIVKAVQAQIMQNGGGIFTNAWDQNLAGTNTKMSTYRDLVAASTGNLKTLDNASRSWLERNTALLGQHIVQWGSFIVLFQAAMSIINGVQSSLNEGIRTAAEFQQQMVQLQSFQRVAGSAGIGLTAAPQSQVWDDASRLAMKYGDNVNDVVQDITLWYKTTGDLNNAMYLTNEAMKFQIVTGSSLEDTYRTLTALQNQASGMKMGLGDNSTFNLSKSAEFLNMIYNAALVAGAGMKQYSDGQLTAANAANILMHAMEQDTESLKKLGLSVAQAVAIDQSLITVMGNTGSGADSAAERISRLVGGFMELSRSAKAASVIKDIGADAYKNLQDILASGKANGDILTALIGYWGTLNDQQRNALSTALAGNRQYQIAQGLMDSISGIYKKILQSERDKASLDQASKQMNDTFNQQVKQLQSEWQVVVAIIGTQLIPELIHAIGFAEMFIARVELGHARLAGERNIGQALQASGSPIVQDTYSIGPFGLGPKASTPDVNASVQTMVNSAINRLAMSKGTSADQTTALENLKNVVAKSTAEQLVEYMGQRSNTFGGKTYGEALGLTNFLNLTSGYGASKFEYEASHADQLALQWQKSQGLGLGANFGGGGSAAPMTPPGKTAGVRDAAQQAKTALDALIDAYHKYADIGKEVVSADEAQITTLQHKMELYGQNQSDMNRIVSLYGNEDNVLKTTNVRLEAYRNAFEKQIANYEKAQSGLAKNSQGYARYQSDIDKAQTELNSVNKAIQDNNNLLTENQYKIATVQNTLAQTRFSRDMSAAQKELENAYKGYQDGLVSLAQVEAARNNMIVLGTADITRFAKGTQAAADAQRTLADDTQSANTQISQEGIQLGKTLGDDIGKYQEDFAKTMLEIEKVFGGSGMEAQINYERQMIDLKKQERDFQVEISKLITQSQGTPFEAQAQQVDRLGQAYFGAAEQAAALAEKQQELTNSPFYQALNSSLGQLGSAVGTSLTNSLFGVNSTNAAIQNLDAEINQLNIQKQLEDQIFSAEQYHSEAQTVAHDQRMYQLNQEIAALQEQAKAEQEKISNPSLLQKVATDFVKTFTDAMLKQASSQAMAMFFKIKPDPSLQTAFDNFHTYLKQDFESPVTDFSNSVGNAQSSDYTFVGAVSNFGQFVQTFANAAGGLGGGSGSAASGLGDVISNGFTWAGIPSGIGGGSASSPFSFSGGVSGGSGGGFSLGNILGGGGSGGGGGLGLALALAGGAGLAIPAIASILRQPGVPTGGAGIPMNGAGSGFNFTPGWGSTSVDSILNDAQFLSTSAPGVTGATSWISDTFGTGGGIGGDTLAALFSGAGTGSIGMGSLGLGSLSGGSSMASAFEMYMGAGGNSPLGASAFPTGISGGASLARGSSGNLFSGIAANGKAFTGMWSQVGSLGKYMGIAGSLYGLYSSVTGGGGLGNALSAAASMAAIAGWTGPVGIGLDALAFIAGLIGIGPHDNPANMPDKYNTQVYGQLMADLFGAGLGRPTWGANGQQFTENSSLASMFGNMGMKNFIEKTLSQYPTKASAPAWLQPMYDTLLALFGNASKPSQDVFHWGHNINQEWVTGPGASGTHTYQDYLNAMNQFINAYTQNLQNAGQATIIALNQFGSGVGFLPGYWDTPGYDYTSNPPPPIGPGQGPGQQGGQPPGQPPGGPHPQPPPPGHHYPPGQGPGQQGQSRHAMYNYRPAGTMSGAGQTANITTTVNLDGRQLARSTQAYTLRVARCGFNRLS